MESAIQGHSGLCEIMPKCECSSIIIINALCKAATCRYNPSGDMIIIYFIDDTDPAAIYKQYDLQVQQ